MEELVGTILRLFSQKTMTFTGPTAVKVAREIQGNQTQLYHTLTSQIATLSVNRRYGGPINVFTYDRLSQVLQWAIKQVGSNPPYEDARDDGTIVVFSTYPLLTNKKIQDFFDYIGAQLFTDELASEFQLVFAGALLVELRNAGQPFNVDQLEGSIKGAVLQGIANYVAGRTIRDYPGFDDRLEKQLATARADFENATAAFEKERHDQRTALDALSAAMVDLEEKRNTLAQSVDSTRDRLKNFETTIRSELQLDRAQLSWEKRYREARVSFGIGVGLLSALSIVGLVAMVIVGPIALDYLYRPTWQSFLTGGVAAIGSHLGRLVVISFPIVLYLWVMRVVVRYFMRSMLLMDDARQRQTMLDTYFLLSSKGRADEMDRPLVLWALFRQTPGHGADGIDPPDFTEVINAGMRRSGANKAPEV